MCHALTSLRKSEAAGPGVEVVDLELARIGSLLFIFADSPNDQNGSSSSIDTFATRLSAQPLSFFADFVGTAYGFAHVVRPTDALPNTPFVRTWDYPVDAVPPALYLYPLLSISPTSCCLPQRLGFSRAATSKDERHRSTSYKDPKWPNVYRSSEATNMNFAWRTMVAQSTTVA
jgi:hypothetical protein